MGVEIPTCEFSKEDFEEFKRKLREESRILMDWFNHGAFESTSGMVGFELEAWLLDNLFLPSPSNEDFLDKVNNHLVVPELSKFNFEINSTPHPLAGPLLSKLEKELTRIWNICASHAEEMNQHILAIGILPTIRNEMLTMENMSSLKRYFALNQEILKLKQGKPLELNVSGKDDLYVKRRDVMLEAAATSLQIHLQVGPQAAVRHYNASIILSAAMVAVAANSPYLFGKDLWDETRIPTFEQAIAVASFRDRHGETIGRVTFGTGYLRQSIMEPFLENLDGFPVLLPMVLDDDPPWLSHLRLHNGTIWRWNRPLIGLNQNGKPHIRIEHRVAAAGPSITDTIANIAFYLGMVHYFVNHDPALEEQIPFEDAKNNFYQAAQNGLRATIKWVQGQVYPLQNLVEEILIPAAREGLHMAGLLEEDISHYLDGVLLPRVTSGQNGAAWQRAFIHRCGEDFQGMTQAYFENQKRNIPVAEWKVSS